MLQLTIEENKIYLQAKHYIDEHYAPEESPCDDEGLIFVDYWSKPRRNYAPINKFSESVFAYFGEDLERLKVICKKAYPCTRAYEKICEGTFAPAKSAICKWLLAAEFDLETAKNFLNSQQHDLHRYEKFDVVMMFFFENKIYDFAIINKILYRLHILPFWWCFI